MAEDLQETTEAPAAAEKPAKKRATRKTTATRSRRTTKAAKAESEPELALEIVSDDSAPKAKPKPRTRSQAKAKAAAREDTPAEKQDTPSASSDDGKKVKVWSSDSAEESDVPTQADSEVDGKEGTGSEKPVEAAGEDKARQHGGGGGRGGRQHGDGGFRKRGKKDKRRGGKHGRDNGPKWKQPPPPVDAPPVLALPVDSNFENLEEMAAKAAEIAEGGEELFLDEIAKAKHAELIAANNMREIEVVDSPGRVQLIENLIKWATENKRPIVDRGYLDVTTEGFGFVVHEEANYRYLPESSYVPAAFIRKFGLKRGMQIEVQVQPAVEGERCPVSLVVRSAMGGEPAEASKVVPFEELTPYYPTERIHLEVPQTDAPNKVDVSMRAFDLLTPVGFGQRGLIVAPPRTGKTILLQGLANSIATNFPEKKLIVLLVDERPEEVTDFRRRVKGEVVSSTFDETPESHVHAAEMVGEKARRMVERGEQVVILLDSITRLARAYNALTSNSGKIMSGGVEATALQKPKRFFGAARNIEGGGSLTIIGTALVETNSRMDEVIFEEFKGTGNMELHLDRDLVNKRIFPAINFERSGTRKEELLYHPDELQKIFGLRRVMLGVPAYEAMEMLIQRLKKTRSNAEFLLSLSR